MAALIVPSVSSKTLPAIRVPSSEIAAFVMAPPISSYAPVFRPQRKPVPGWPGSEPGTAPTTTDPSAVMSVGPPGWRGDGWRNSGAPGSRLNVMFAVTGAPAATFTVVQLQRLSVEPSPLSVSPLKYSSGPGSTMTGGTAKAPATRLSTYST